MSNQGKAARSTVTAYFRRAEDRDAFLGLPEQELACIEPGLAARCQEMKARMVQVQRNERQTLQQQKLNAFARSGRDCRAALLILTSPLLNRDGRVWQHVDLDRHQIHFRKMLADYTFSSGERSMIRLAASLFNGDHRLNLYRTLNGLDYSCSKIALDAIATYMGVR